MPRASGRGNLLTPDQFEDLVLKNVGNSERGLERFIHHLRIRYWSPRINRVNRAPRWVMDALWWIWHCQLYPIRRESGRWNFTGYATGSVGSRYDATAKGVPGILAQVAQSTHVVVSRVRLPQDADELRRLIKAVGSLRDTRISCMMNMWVNSTEHGHLTMLNSSGIVTPYSETDVATCWVVVEPPPDK
ncbi:MAG: hypothetical protein WC734_01440 [Patescibacteria group bacterium]